MHCKKRRNPVYLAKTVPKTMSNAAYSTWRKMSKINRNWTGKLQLTLIFACLHTFKASWEEITNRDEFWENEGKIHERGCAKEFFS